MTRHGSIILGPIRALNSKLSIHYHSRLEGLLEFPVILSTAQQLEERNPPLIIFEQLVGSALAGLNDMFESDNGEGGIK